MPSYPQGSSDSLTVANSNGTAWWDIVDGKYGVSYARNSNEGFIEVPGVTVIASNYTITYHLNGGTGDSSGSYTFGTGLEPLPTPTRTGWTFGGWFEDEDFTGSEVTAILATDTGDKIFYAKWNDTTEPTGEIKIRNNAFTTFLNTITFELFFSSKGTVDVTITGEDGGSGVATVEYLLSDIAYTDVSEMDSVVWAEYTNTFPINANWKGYIYARITDNAAHVIIIRSDGIVVYTNSTATANADYIYGSGLDLVVDIDMNGNTFKSMTGDITADDYTVDNDAQIITFSKEFMATLDYGTNHAPKNHMFTVEWNPLGFTFVSGDDNEEPGKTTITITVKSPCESSHTPDTSANCTHCQNCGATELARICTSENPCAFHYEAPPIFEPCGPDCKGEGECDEPCEAPPEYALGDCNNDGRINIADLTYLKYAIVGNNPEVFPLNDQCKVAGEGASDALNLYTLRNYLTGVIPEFPDN